MTDSTTDWRERGKLHPPEQVKDAMTICLNNEEWKGVNLAQAERIVSRWEWVRWLVETGRMNNENV